MVGIVRSVVGRMAMSVMMLAARLATNTQPTPKSVSKSPTAIKSIASPTFASTLSAFSATNFNARPCSRNREKGIIVATSSRMMAATRFMYEGCATYAGPITRATPPRNTITNAKNTAAATIVAPHVVAKTRRLPLSTRDLSSPPSASALAAKRK